jgi:anti-sigma factor RsiW
MNDSRFIELLNLYVDREITPAEAAELEAEVQASPQRRRSFNQYCRMDRACTLVLTQGQPAPAPSVAADNVAQLPEQSGTPSKLIFLGGMLAAAAAIAIVFYQRGAAPAPAANPAPVRPASQVAQVASTPVPTGREATVALPFGNRSDSIAASVRPSFAWMKQMDFQVMTPLTEEDLMLVARPEKPFSSRLTWGLHRESTNFPRAGVTRRPTELNAFELGK